MAKTQITKKTKTILIGTSEFAERIFRKTYLVLQNKFEIIAVVTAPDKLVGRKQELLFSPVKKFALDDFRVKFSNSLILQPKKINSPEWIKKIQELAPELIVLTAYGQIIPKEILDLPRFGALNIHPSLLPKYRGASPIQTAILNGDKETGVVLTLMDEKMDHGPIIQTAKYKMQNTKITYQELSEELANLGANLLIKALPDWVEGKIKARPQEHSRASFCKILKKEDGIINWNKSAEEIGRQVRAYHKWPCAYTKIEDKILKILEADVLVMDTQLDLAKDSIVSIKKIGKIFLTDNKELAIQTGNGILILKQVQLEGKKSMLAHDFLNGHQEIIGTTCGTLDFPHSDPHILL